MWPLQLRAPGCRVSHGLRAQRAGGPGCGWRAWGLNHLLTADSGAPEPQPTPPKKDRYSKLVRCSPEATQESKSLGEEATSNKSPYSKGLQKIAVVSTRGLAGQKA